MPDELFANPRLARIYDAVDGERDDLDLYVSMVEEFGARTVLDLGCGTGTLPCRLAADGVDVIGVDPAAASLDVARVKPGAEGVRWIHGDATTLPALTAHMATMTGNVAQVFLDDADWLATLAGLAGAVTPAGRLVFETRIPQQRAWERWTRKSTWRRLDIPEVGTVETWIDLTEVSLPFVSFCATYRFERDGAVLTSESTLRFRELDEIEESLIESGWHLVETRDAPDRPGHEWVCVATRSD